MTEPNAIAEGLFACVDGGPRLVCRLCRACHRHHFPASDTCPYCGGPGTVEALLGPDATLWAWTSVTAPPPGYAGDVPYGFGVVQLPQGLHVVSRLTEPDPTALAFGQAMHLVVTTVATPDGASARTWAFAPGRAGAER